MTKTPGRSQQNQAAVRGLKRLSRLFWGALDQMMIEADPANLPPHLRPVKAEISPPAALLEMQSDKPISSATEDVFGRSSFAKRAANVLARRADSSSIIVGIFGPWGDGKTSTLAMMREALRHEANVIVIDYNPWFFEGSTENLTRSFFKTIGNALERSPIFSRENIGRSLEKYAEAIPKFGKPLSNLGKSLASENLHEARDKIGKILRKNSKRVVIFIDDIDRLDRKEIQTLFKLVRLSGDFEYTSYVLAFDEAMVAEALSDAYGGHEHAGGKFLEKIIQIPLHLPAADKTVLRQMAFASCDRVLQYNDIEMTETQGSELGNAFALGFTPVLKTPRQVKLFENAISFAIPLLKGEANPIDQILIEGIRVFYPELYALVRDDSAFFLKSASRRDASSEDKPARLRAVLSAAGVPPAEANSVLHHLLEKLFPRLQASEYGRDWENEWASEQRVCSAEYFPRYFNYGVPAKDVSDRSISALIEAAASPGDALANSLIEFQKNGTISSVLTKLRQRQEQIPGEAIPGLVASLVILSREMRYVDSLFGFSEHDEAALLVARLIERAAEEQRESLVSVVTTGAKDPGFAFQTLRWMLASDDESKRGFMTAEGHRAAVDSVASRWLAEHGTAPVESLPKSAPGHFLSYINAYASEGVKDAVRQVLVHALRDDPSVAHSLLRAFTPIATNLATGTKSVSDLRSDAYDTMSQIIDTDALYSCLLDRYGSILEEPDYGSRYDSESDEDEVVDERLARQFSFLHLKRREEASRQHRQPVVDDAPE